MTVYLIDEPFTEIGLSIAADGPTARVVLVQDAVYRGRDEGIRAGTYAIRDDVSRRGLLGALRPGVQVIGYDALVEMMEAERAVCFL